MINFSLNQLIIINLWMAYLLISLVIFILLRRILITPYNLLYTICFTHYSKFLSNYLKTKDNKTSRVTHPVFSICRSAFEDVLLLQINKLKGQKQKKLIELYSSSGLLARRLKELESSSVWRRRNAIDRLSRSRSHDAVTGLLMALRDPDSAVKLIAVKALGQVKATRAIPFIISLFKDFPEDKCVVIANTLIGFGASTAPYVLENLFSTEEKVRYWLLRTLAELPIRYHPGSQEYLRTFGRIETLTQSVSPRARAYAVFCLGQLPRSNQSFRSILPLLSDRAVFVRQKATEACGNILDKRSLPYLIEKLGDHDWDVAEAAQDALFNFGRTALRTVRKGLGSKKIIIREHCKSILSYFEGIHD